LDAKVTLDSSGCLVGASHAAEAVLGVSANAAIGRPLAELLSRANSEQFDELSSLLSRSPSGERAHRIELSAGGDDDPPRWLELLITPRSDPPGTVVWLEDITERKAAAVVTQRRVSLMERAEQVAEIGSWEWPPEHERLEWSDNLYRLYGLQPGSIAPTIDYVLEQTHPEHRERLARVTAFSDRRATSRPWSTGSSSRDVRRAACARRSPRSTPASAASPRSSAPSRT